MNRLILADDQTIFQTGVASVLALEDDMQISALHAYKAQILAAIDEFRRSILLVSSSLRLDIRELVVRARAAESRVILITENAEYLSGEIVLLFDGVLTGSGLVECVRQVARGWRFVRRSSVGTIQTADQDGAQVLNRLTPKEMQIVALAVRGRKNRDIAVQLRTSEQVIKNYLRSICSKAGVSGRLELALFTISHRILAEAVSEAGQLIESKST